MLPYKIAQRQLGDGNPLASVSLKVRNRQMVGQWLSIVEETSLEEDTRGTSGAVNFPFLDPCRSYRYVFSEDISVLRIRALLCVYVILQLRIFLWTNQRQGDASPHLGWYPQPRFLIPAGGSWP